METKLEAIWEYLNSVKDVDYSEDVYSDSGGNFDDAYSLGYDAGESFAVNHIKNILLEL